MVAVTNAVSTRLGKYEILKRLARGGMAELWLARADGIEGFERHVVIKRIRADHEDDRQFVEMFVNEARLAAKLHHNNIVQVHDIGIENGKPYFVMEYVHGQDVRRLLANAHQRGEQLPLEHVISIASAIAVALHHAHEQVGTDRQPLGIVHRDITPANILIGYDGTVKVADFGIAKAAMRRTETQPGVLKGKVPYMAPEQCTGGAVDRRSDVFGLGIVLYEMATVRRLFKGGNEYTTMAAVVRGEIPKPSLYRPDLPPELDAIILRALERDVTRRYQSADEMFQALDAFAAAKNLRTSTTGLAAYMRKLFGQPPEPWLVDEVAPEVVVSVDFDGSVDGIATSIDTPVDGALPQDSPIAIARSRTQDGSVRSPPPPKAIRRPNPTKTPVPGKTPVPAKAPVPGVKHVIPPRPETAVSVAPGAPATPPPVPALPPIIVESSPASGRAETDVDPASNVGDSTDVIRSPLAPIKGDDTAVVRPLPSPLLMDRRPRRKSSAPPPVETRVEAPVEAPSVIEAVPVAAATFVAEPARPRRWWLFGGIGAAAICAVALVIGFSGGDATPAPGDPPPEPAASATVIEPPPVVEEPPPSRPAVRTWRNSQPTAAVEPVAVEPVAVPPEPVAVTPEPAVVPPEPVEPPAPQVVDEPRDPDPPPVAKPTKPKPTAQPVRKPVAKPNPAPVRPKPKPVAKPTKPTPTTTPTKPNWDPNSLFPKGSK